MAAKSHRDLHIWLRSRSFVQAVYKLSESFPKHELFGLTSPLRRAAVSIPANIAEGNARSSLADYARFVSIARGSAAEAETLLFIACDLQFVSTDEAADVLREIDELGRMLTVMHQRMSEVLKSPRPS